MDGYPTYDAIGLVRCGEVEPAELLEAAYAGGRGQSAHQRLEQARRWADRRPNLQGLTSRRNRLERAFTALTIETSH